MPDHSDPPHVPTHVLSTRERAADALADALDVRGLAFRRVDADEVTVLCPYDDSVPPIWITRRYVRWRTGQGVDNSQVRPLDTDPDDLATEILGPDVPDDAS